MTDILFNKRIVLIALYEASSGTAFLARSPLKYKILVLNKFQLIWLNFTDNMGSVFMSAASENHTKEDRTMSVFFLQYLLREMIMSTKLSCRLYHINCDVGCTRFFTVVSRIFLQNSNLSNILQIVFLLRLLRRS